MLITIMSSIGGSAPYTSLIIWVQYLPQYFNQPYAGSFAYQILIGLATNYIGYGLAGVCRRFLVYPSYCVWPTSLVTIALNNAFHEGVSTPVMGPFKKLITMSRLRFFLYTFTGMFIYFWLPNILFQAMSIFNWISWIDPWNVHLNSVVGFNNGLGVSVFAPVSRVGPAVPGHREHSLVWGTNIGVLVQLNPVPTFDWNNMLHGGADPLVSASSGRSDLPPHARSGDLTFSDATVFHHAQ